jgi:FMN phosphatase YigB (HAD superfamily)
MNHIDRIEAISFDGDETLWNFQTVMRRALSVTLEELRRRVPMDASADLTVERPISVWFNRDGEGNDSGIVPDYEIQSLTGLADVMER